MNGKMKCLAAAVAALAVFGGARAASPCDEGSGCFLGWHSCGASCRDRSGMPVAISLLPCLEFPCRCSSVEGLRLNLLIGRHRNVSWLDFGILANVVTETATGLQIALVNSAQSLSGLQIGLVNHATDGSEGLQIGLVNVMSGAKFPVCPIINIGFGD